MRIDRRAAGRIGQGKRRGQTGGINPIIHRIDWRISCGSGGNPDRRRSIGLQQVCVNRLRRQEGKIGNTLNRHSHGLVAHQNTGNRISILSGDSIHSRTQDLKTTTLIVLNETLRQHGGIPGIGRQIYFLKNRLPHGAGGVRPGVHCAADKEGGENQQDQNGQNQHKFHQRLPRPISPLP